MTLVELVFAAGILATALSIVFGSLVSISMLGRLNETRAEGMLAVSSIMEEINRLPISELRSYVAPQVEAPGVYHSVSVAFILPGSDEGAVSLPLPENYTGGIPNPVEVQVTLQWQDDRGRAYQVQQSTMRGE